MKYPQQLTLSHNDPTLLHAKIRISKQVKLICNLNIKKNICFQIRKLQQGLYHEMK